LSQLNLIEIGFLILAVVLGSTDAFRLLKLLEACHTIWMSLNPRNESEVIHQFSKKVPIHVLASV
jgi:hypothetical protein